MSHQAFVVNKSFLIDEDNNEAKDRCNTLTEHNANSTLLINLDEKSDDCDGEGEDGDTDEKE